MCSNYNYNYKDNPKRASYNFENIPIGSRENIPLALLEQCGCTGSGCSNGRRRYTRTQEVESLAIDKYNRSRKGITYRDLLGAGLVAHKHQAQLRLKYCRNRGILFTPEKHKPQQYYPTCLKSEILKAKMSKNIPVNPTGVSNNNNSSNLLPSNGHPESVIIQTLEGYVLPLLPAAPLFIYNMHFKLKISPEYYHELNLQPWKINHGKHQSDVIGKTSLDYVFYANGTVEVHTRSSNNPHKLEDEVDRSRLIAFFGQIRDRLVTFLMDRHERIVPDLMKWQLTECDINKDIKVSDSLHICGIKIQVKHLDHIFRIYIKSMGSDTVCRVEQSLVAAVNSAKKSPIEFIDDTYNPNKKIENEIAELGNKVDRLLLILANINCSSNAKKDGV